MDKLPEYQPGKPWQEQKLDVPAYPTANDLISLDTQFDDYHYYIDKQSVSVGDEDQVARYTVVIDSEDGVRNVFYEGIRCDTRQYKTYAFGSGAGPFQRMQDTGWHYIRSEAAFRYRRDLLDYYVCDGPTVRFDPKQIVRRIANPPSLHDSTFVN